LCDWFFFNFIFWHLICWRFSFIQSYRSTLVFFLNIGFVIIFIFYIGLSWSHDEDYGFCMSFSNISFFKLF
jgi:hypothetical protein